MAIYRRPESPYLRGQWSQKMVTEEDKIHRILPRCSTICRLAYVYSPNCLWFKLVNDVSKQLQLCKPTAQLHQLKTAPKEFDYCMAPLDEQTYARGRIAKIHALGNIQLVYVHFIDEGFGAWMLTHCLAQMPKEFFAYPWQAFPVSLFKAKTCKEFSSIDSKQEGWPDCLLMELKQIMGEYELFKIEPVPSKLNKNYSVTHADIFGLEFANTDEGEPIDGSNKPRKKGKQKTHKRQKQLDEEGESIANRLACALQPTEFLDREVFDTQQQPLPPLEIIPNLTRDQAIRIYEEIPKWRQSFPTDFSPPQSAQIQLEENADWSTEAAILPMIQPLSIAWLKEHCFLDGNYAMLLDWHSLKSPHEFYAFPLRQMTNGGSSSNKPILYFYELRANLSAQLDNFYSNSANRRPINVKQIYAQLDHGMCPVFAIYENTDEVHGNSFRRVQILSIQRKLNENIGGDDDNGHIELCRVRFVDNGGTCLLPLSRLLRIHSIHCEHPPMCIQMSLESIRPPVSGSNWTQEEINYFKSQLRADVPAYCKLRELKNGQRNNGNVPARKWPGVFAASELLIGGRNVVDAMVDAGKADWV